MGTTILRVEKIKSMANVRQSGAHQFRHHADTPNADPAKKSKNHTFIGSGNLGKDVQSRLDELTKPPRKNAVLAMDGLVTLSPELLKSNDNLNKWAHRTRDWLKQRFGDNLVSAVVHLDESSPHMHFTVVPMEEKPDGRKVLNARDMFDKWELADMQKSYNQEMQRHIENVVAPKYGSKAKHTELKHFYAEIDAMGDRLFEHMLQAKEGLIADASKNIMERLAPMIERQFRDVEEKLGNPIPPEMRQELMQRHQEKAIGLINDAFTTSGTNKDFVQKLTAQIEKEKKSWKTPDQPLKSSLSKPKC